MQKPRVLFLDDNDVRLSLIDNWQGIYWDLTLCKTAEEAIEHLKDGKWDAVFLDHDLGEEVFVDSTRPDCGMEVVRWVEEHKPDVRQFIVHSWNVGAARLMVLGLRRAGYPAVNSPFDSSIYELVHDVS